MSPSPKRKTRTSEPPLSIGEEWRRYMMLNRRSEAEYREFMRHLYQEPKTQLPKRGRVVRRTEY